jgi:hypothetical protein
MKTPSELRMNRQKLLAIGLAVIMVFAAGCASWGTDGPADPDNATGEPPKDSNPNAGEPNDETNSDSNDDSPSGSDSDTDSESKSDTDSDSDSDSDSSDSDSDSDTDSDSDSNSNDSDSPSTPQSSPDSDNSDSDSDSDGPSGDSDTDSDSDSDSSDSDSDSDSNGSDDQPNGSDNDSDGDSSDGDSDTNGSDNDSDGDGDGNTSDGDGDNESYAYNLTIGVRDDNPEYGEGVEGELVTVEQGGETNEYYTDRFGVVDLTKSADSPDESFEYTVTVQDQTKTVSVTEGNNSVEFIVPYIPIGGPMYTLTVEAGEALVATGAEISVAYPDDGAVIETKTVEDGPVTFELSDGDYVVSGEDVNGMTAERSATIDGKDEIIIFGGLYPKFPEETELTVSVVDTDDNPIEGATVDGVSGRHPRGHDILVRDDTDANGQAVLPVYEGYSYALTASYDGEFAGGESVMIEDGPVSTEIRMDNVDLDGDNEEETNVEEGTGNQTVQNESARLAAPV